MAVSTQGLQVIRVIVLRITVYVVHIKLGLMLWNEPTVLTELFAMAGIWTITESVSQTAYS